MFTEGSGTLKGDGIFSLAQKMAEFQNQGLISLPYPKFSALHFSHGLVHDTENKAFLHWTNDCSFFILKRMQKAGWREGHCSRLMARQY